MLLKPWCFGTASKMGMKNWISSPAALELRAPEKLQGLFNPDNLLAPDA
jgi:hypothetical protein